MDQTMIAAVVAAWTDSCQDCTLNGGKLCGDCAWGAYQDLVDPDNDLDD